MDEGRIVLIGNDSDILHCGYSHAISDSGKRYPSVDHYAHSMILSQLGLSEDVILELLCTQTREVPLRARELLQENMPAGHDMNSLANYLATSRQSYTMNGLRIRAEQDASFERALMNTKDALLIVCDSRDHDLGIGMEEQQFIDWMARERVDAHQLAYWMKDEMNRPSMVGKNQLGYFLMWLRFEVREKKKVNLLSTKSRLVDGISTDQNEKPLQMSVNDLVISLQGVFRPLSNYYPIRFEMKGESYRSVEHYAYEKLFLSLKLDDKQIEKITTTVDPESLKLVAKRVFKKEEMSEATLSSKMSRLDRWRQSAMKHKIFNNEYLQQLLLSTGDALLIDPADGDPQWTCGASEMELQHLLTKSYIDSERLVMWMRNNNSTSPSTNGKGKENKVPANLAVLIGNTAGLLLMELRAKLAKLTVSSTSRIPLISPMNLNALSSLVSPHVICFTAESVWHPLYPAEIRPESGKPLLPSPCHYVAQEAIKFLSINKPDAEYIMETSSSVECWQRLHEILTTRSYKLDKETSWWMERRQSAMKEALTLLLEQHQPLLRALLDTQDALLVYCARFSSMEAELSIGMREMDLRAWMQHVDISSKQLIELCNRPLAFRPAYLGGNRLGFILMELRREFMLRGVFPQTLPELPIGAEAILGTDSPLENMMVGQQFNVMDSENYTSFGISPLMLLAKEQKKADLLALATQTKSAPRLVSLDDERITSIVDDLDSMAGKVDESYLSECAPEELRAVFMRICVKIRQKMTDMDEQQNDMNGIAREIHQMQFMRRSLEEAKIPQKNMSEGRESGSNPIMEGPVLTPLMSGRDDRMPIRRMPGGSDRPERRFPERGNLLDGPLIPPPPRSILTSVRRNRSPEDRGPRKIRGDLIPHQRRAFSPRRDRERERSFMERDRGREREREPIKRRLKSITPPPVQSTPTPTKAKVPRPADEELSEGEIVDSD